MLIAQILANTVTWSAALESVDTLRVPDNYYGQSKHHVHDGCLNMIHITTTARRFEIMGLVFVPLNGLSSDCIFSKWLRTSSTKSRESIGSFLPRQKLLAESYWRYFCWVFFLFVWEEEKEDSPKKKKKQISAGSRPDKLGSGWKVLLCSLKASWHSVHNFHFYQSWWFSCCSLPGWNKTFLCFYWQAAVAAAAATATASAQIYPGNKDDYWANTTLLLQIKKEIEMAECVYRWHERRSSWAIFFFLILLVYVLVNNAKEKAKKLCIF